MNPITSMQNAITKLEKRVKELETPPPTPSDAFDKAVVVTDNVVRSVTKQQLITFLSQNGGISLDQVLSTETPFTANRIINMGTFSLIIGDGHLVIFMAGDFADNAAALAGGVLNGELYFTQTGTERFVKQAHD